MIRKLFTCGIAILLAGPVVAAPVDTARLVAADQEKGAWLTHGRNYAEDRESPLTSITPDNVSDLGLAWYFDTGTTRGLEASPLMIDGMLFTTGSWSTVFALDARTGKLVWSFDPQVPREWGANACCDVVNRGVAAWGDNIYVGTLDGRLIALDRASGAVRWDTPTIPPDRPYTITGAPRAINGKIIIGNGGAEYGVRGYLSAFDAESGELAWRFYTVPGNPSEPYESQAMQMAAATWTGDVYWQVGGGGTVWDSMAYDPELNLLYFGVGNGAPWNRHVRSPEGGDNLFLSSIVAVNPDTGQYVWHYQTTPGDSWDYTATQHMILAEIDVSGQTRKVLMQAPKNGFFYVIDRATGELLSAEKYSRASWASHVDMTTGRPVETENADHRTTTRLTRPAPTGGHNWQPMAFNHDTGLVFIPAMESEAPYSTAPNFKYRPGHHWNTGQNDSGGDDNVSSLPPGLMAAVIKRLMIGKLIAWDPVAQKEKWHVSHTTMWNGGLLTTVTGLVFQGTGDGHLKAYAAGSGDLLWQADTVTGIIAPPVSYELDGIQYIALMAGWGGAGGLVVNLPGSAAAGNGRLLVYKLGGDASLPTRAPERVMPTPPPRRGTDASISHGSELYNINCGRCHGMSLSGSSLVSDLRYLSSESHGAFKQIVLGGALTPLGMVAFNDVLTEKDAEDIHNYIIDGAHLKWDEDHSSPWWQEVRAMLYEAAAVVLGWFM